MVLYKQGFSNSIGACMILTDAHHGVGEGGDAGVREEL